MEAQKPTSAAKPAEKKKVRGIKNAFYVILACFVVAICLFLFVFGHPSHFNLIGDNIATDPETGKQVYDFVSMAFAPTANEVEVAQGAVNVTGCHPIDLIGTVYKGGFIVPILQTLFLALTEGLDEELDEPIVENSTEVSTDVQNEETEADYIEDTIESAPTSEPSEVNQPEEIQAEQELSIDEPVNDAHTEDVYEPVNVHISEPIYTADAEPINTSYSESKIEDKKPDDIVEYNPNYEFVEMTAETVVTDMEPEAPIFIDRDDDQTMMWEQEPDSPKAETKPCETESEQIQPNTTPTPSANTQETEPIPYRRTYVITDNQFDRNRSTANTVFQEPAPARRPISSVFNLNDKFRFRRELFGNSDAQYVECLDLLSAMSSLDEAKDYLYEDLNWDSNNDDVKAFVDLLANYYK